MTSSQLWQRFRAPKPSFWCRFVVLCSCLGEVPSPRLDSFWIFSERFNMLQWFVNVQRMDDSICFWFQNIDYLQKLLYIKSFEWFWNKCDLYVCPYVSICRCSAYPRIGWWKKWPPVSWWISPNLVTSGNLGGVDFFVESDDLITGSVGSILSLFLGGEATGQSWAAVLFGDVSPSGRLPLMMPETEADSIPPSSEESGVWKIGWLGYLKWEQNLGLRWIKMD